MGNVQGGLHILQFKNNWANSNPDLSMPLPLGLPIKYSRRDFKARAGCIKMCKRPQQWQDKCELS